MPHTQVDLTLEVKNVLPVVNGGAGGNVNAQTGTSYTIVAADNRKLVTFENSSPVTAILTSAASLGNLFVCWVENLGAGTVTITPSTGAIDGAASLALAQNQGTSIWSDGSNFFTERGMGSGGGGGVSSLDGITGAVVLSPGNAISVTDNSPSTGDIEIASPTFVASGASHAPGSVPDPGATAGTTRLLREDASWQVPSGGGSSPSATTATITTASLATGASESGSVAIFRSFMLLEVQYSCKARVELYATAAARTADASRAWGTIPTLYAQNELISDTQESTGAATWVMSPAALGFNADSPRTTTIYYRVANLDTPQAVTITLTVLQMES